MKAVVLEIHKNYCIAVTGDGQFLRQDIQAGNLEVGDEITVEETLPYPSARSWVKRLVIASTAAVVVVLGGFGLYKILPLYLPGMGTARETAAVADEALKGENDAGEKAFAREEEQAGEIVLAETAGSAEEAGEAGTGSAESADDEEEYTGEGQQAADTLEYIPEGAGEIDAGFDLELGGDNQLLEVVAGNLLISYQRIEAEGVYSLSLIIENMSPDYKYSGIAAFEIRTSAGDICGLDAFEFKEFSTGEEFEQTIALSCPGDLARVELKGKFE